MSTGSDTPRMARIHAALAQALAPSVLELIDDSHRHAGHAGAREGGHYTLRIAAPAFAGKRPVQCHRLIYAALGELMQTDIHALAIELLPDS
ncbi:MAG: BolA family protein [Immundisolibacter sp.]|uniref:BolA family protein n=1 Tax=Immundisolibacter sp. TaxID=1934948 RepID=UPI003D136B84